MAVIAAIGVMAIVGTTLWLLVAGIAGRNSAARATPGWTVQSVLEAAFLVGGPSRVVDTVISTMHEAERVQVMPHGRLQVLRPVAANGIEGAVLAACGPEWEADLKEVRASAMRSPAVQEIGDALAAHGLLYRPESIRNWRLAARVQRPTCFFTGFALIGSTFILMGQATGQSGDVFTIFPVFFGAIVATIIGQLLAPRGRLTKAGKNAVAQLRRHNPWVPAGTAARGPAVPALVAIGGVGVLTPGPLRDELMASVAGGGRSFGGSGSSYSSDSSASDPGGAAWCGSSSGGCGGGSGCGASSCGGGSSGGGGGSSCGGGGGGCGGGGGGTGGGG